MAYTFDATAGGFSANSYATIEQLNDYFGGRYPSELWNGLSTLEQQQIATTATRRLDQESYYGLKTTDAQALQFPRHGIFDRNGSVYSATEIPQNLINAQAELIYFLLQSEDRTLSELDLHDADALTNYSVGPLNYGFKGKVKANQLPQNVKDELAAIGECWVDSKLNPNVISR